MEARDVSWSIGKGSDAQLTLPHLVDFYRPASNASNASAKLHGPLIGASTTAVFPAGISHLPHGDFHPKTDGLNVAESSGAVHRNSMVEQFALIQQQRAALPGLDADFDARWKLLTIWMTANDVCGLCDGTVSDAFLDKWSAGYDALLANMTKTSTCVCMCVCVCVCACVCVCVAFQCRFVIFISPHPISTSTPILPNSLPCCTLSRRQRARCTSASCLPWTSPT
jgi:hypothetical protein